MATREELDEKYDDCQETPDYVAVALLAFKDLKDKEWAVELYEEGADWAATALWKTPADARSVEPPMP